MAYVAFSRVRALEDLFLLQHVSLEDLNRVSSASNKENFALLKREMTWLSMCMKTGLLYVCHNTRL